MAGAWLIDRFAIEFWDTSHDYGVQPPLTDEALAECERLLGVSLPADYVALLRVQNGGVVARRYSAFRTGQPTTWASDHVPFEHCSGIGPHFPSINESAYLNAEWGQDAALVLLHGDGHWWIALDYRVGGSSQPCVTWLDNEVGHDIRLADTFREFLVGLSVPPPLDA